MDAGSAYRSDVYEYTGADLRPDSSLCFLPHLLCLRKKGKNIMAMAEFYCVQLQNETPGTCFETNEWGSKSWQKSRGSALKTLSPSIDQESIDQEGPGVFHSPITVSCQLWTQWGTYQRSLVYQGP